MQNVWTNPVVLNLYKHAEPLRSFPSFCRTLFLPNITESKNRLLQRWPWLAYYDVTTLLVIIQMTFVEPWNGSVEPEAQSALHFGDAIFMNFHSIIQPWYNFFANGHI